MQNSNAPSLTSLDTTFGNEAQPRHAFPPSLDTVPDGEVTCRIEGAEMAIAKGAHVVRVSLALLSHGGRVVQHTYWLNNQIAVNGFLAEMKALRFQTDGWGNGPSRKPLSQAIPHCVKRLPGHIFSGVKRSRFVPGKPATQWQAATEDATYHELFISGPVKDEPPAGAPPQMVDERPTVPAGVEDGDIPFSLLPFFPWIGALVTIGGLLA